MKRQSKIQVVAVIILLLIAQLCIPLLVQAGNLEPSGPPSAGTMHSLEDIYDVVKAFKKTPPEVCAGVTFIGLRADGTIGELVGTKDCGTPVTTSTTSAIGPTTTTTVIAPTTTTTVIPGERFVDNYDGTVTDTRTGLVWLQNANQIGPQKWIDAMAYCSGLRSGLAGTNLNDGSVAGDWRLPMIEELQEIGTDPPSTFWSSTGIPFVPWTTPGAPFINLFLGSLYWSSTDYTYDSNCARAIDIDNGHTAYPQKNDQYFFLWPVRAGQ